jgi:PKD repeat protein
VFVTDIHHRDYLILRTIETDWEENTTTWEDKPSTISSIGNLFLTYENRWYTWDITEHIQKALADGEIGFSLICDEHLINGHVYLNAKESATYQPTIEVSYVVLNEQPVAKANGPYEVTANETFSFNVSGTTDPDGTIVGYRWDFENDGTYDTDWLEDGNVSHSYEQSGEYTARLEIVDDADATDSDTALVIVESQPNQPPQAKVNGLYNGYVGSALRFYSSGSTDSDGSIVSYFWEFGDSTNSTSRNPSHVYSEEGTYTVTLTITDDDGATASNSTTAVIAVANNPPSQPELYGPQNGDQNTAYTFTVEATDPDDHDVKFVFSWGDGESYTTELMSSGSVTTIQHSWSTYGKYTIAVKALDEHNAASGLVGYAILIDIFYVEHLGYLIDSDNDNVYDQFYSNETFEKTEVEEEGGTYKLDTDNDGSWDYVYDVSEGSLDDYEQEEEEGFPWWIVAAALIVIPVVIYSGYYLYNKRIEAMNMQRARLQKRQIEFKQKQRESKHAKKHSSSQSREFKRI